MKLFPAIDLRGGKVVRLQKGDFGAETIYGDDPLVVARSFEEQGAQWIHVVDLDAARTGSATNRNLIEEIAGSVDIPVQTGGGVRDHASADALLSTGVRRIVLGTVAVKDPQLVRRLADDFPGRIAVGLDARGGRVAAAGWTEGSDQTVADLVRSYEDSGVAAFIVTDIERDGMLNGPDLSGLSDVLATTVVDVVASGGVSSLADIQALKSLSVGDKGVAGVIVGKALYENRFSVGEAIKVCEGFA